ncbi:DUF4974 domain-containing protein [Echinicola sp. CAU 1574]|uniref:DUF4974 domain-containing protein n=1 Tax=Echinicola arenosa TaxID=2774144 RepID=A0ABR9AJX1_9BACT|nr:FecR family protein [Echinicola arenosa]MBD8489101.1 DUF4974 domain-containing protein [Echinicola arenosa]
MKDHINTVEDFLEDDDFRKWVMDNEPRHLNLFWIRWMEKYPDKVVTLREAKTILENLREETVPLGDDKKQQIRVHIKESLKKTKRRAQQERNLPRDNNISWILKIAVVLLVTLIAGGIYKDLIFKKSDPVSVAHEEWVVRSNAKGQKSKIHLPDGSTVILNADSQLEFNKTGFGLTHRNVVLEGEAFFDVAHDTLRPFKVTSGTLLTTALGTSFNIKAYRSFPTEVYLTTGKVEIRHQLEQSKDEKIFLNPGEEALVNESNHLVKQKGKNIKHFQWKEGVLFFEKIPFSEVVKQLERWYGVDIKVLGQDAKTPLINGEFKQETLKNVLETMKYSLDFSFQIQQEHVTIDFRT